MVIWRSTREHINPYGRSWNRRSSSMESPRTPYSIYLRQISCLPTQKFDRRSNGTPSRKQMYANVGGSIWLPSCPPIQTPHPSQSHSMRCFTSSRRRTKGIYKATDGSLSHNDVQNTCSGFCVFCHGVSPLCICSVACVWRLGGTMHSSGGPTPENGESKQLPCAAAGAKSATFSSCLCSTPQP
jgi:hypothetical protein